MLTMDRKRFDQAAAKILSREHENHGIGTLGEKTLHAVVKNYVEPDEDYHEVPLEGYVADVYRDGHVFEIQTANFNTMRGKLETFLPLYQVTIVYPVPATKWLRWIDVETGEVTDRRRSPKRGTPQAVFHELYKIKPFLKDPNLSIRILMIDVEESRLLDGWSQDRKKGSHRHNRVPVGLVEDLCLEQAEDYRMMVPPELETFDSYEYAKASRLTVSRAQTALNVMHYLGAVDRVGRKGRRYLYEVAEQRPLI